MWKNRTSPNLILQQHSIPLSSPQANMSAMPKLCDLSFADTEPLKKINQCQPDGIIVNLLQFQSKSSIDYNSGTNQNQLSQLSFKMNKKLSKQNLIVMELQQNEELRMNLFRAEKTILDLDGLCKDMQKGILSILSSKKQEIMSKLSDKSKQIQNSENIYNKKTKRKLKQNQKQNLYDLALIDKQEEITQIWRKCYSDLLEYMNNYSKDITFLTEQYKALEEKNLIYKKNSRKSKKNQENLLKILKESCLKLERSQHTIEKALQDLKQRDNKIQEYQIQNKNIKMKILENLEEIQKLKRENKMHVRDCTSYKQVAKSLQDQLTDWQNRYQSLQVKIENKQKLEEIHKDNQQALKSRIQTLEEELSQTKKFNENLMDEYKKLASKIDQNEEKISEKYQASSILQQQQTKQYQKFINTLQREKQLLIQKNQNKLTILEEEIQKTYKIKVSLQKQLSERSLAILHAQQEKQKLEQKCSNMQLDFSTIIEQKDRQIAYLEQLKAINHKKNEQLRYQLDEVRNDMILILEQLKVKELQIEKYKFSSNHYERKSGSASPVAGNKKDKVDMIDSMFYRQLEHDSEDESQENKQGIIWKNTRKQKSSTLFEQNTDQLPSLNSPQIQKILVQQDSNPTDRTNKFMGTFNKTAKNLQLSQNPSSILKLTNRSASFSYINPVQNSKQSKQGIKPSEVGNSPRHKFNLQAFQNKLVLEESAKLFLQFNKTMLK